MAGAWGEAWRKTKRLTLPHTPAPRFRMGLYARPTLPRPPHRHARPRLPPWGYTSARRFRIGLTYFFAPAHAAL